MRLPLVISAAALGLAACSPAPAGGASEPDDALIDATIPASAGSADAQPRDSSTASGGAGAAAPQDPPPVREGAPADPDRPVGGPWGEMPKGGLTLSGFQDRSLERFRRADANGDGVVDASEMEASGRGGRRMGRSDANGDGRVTEAEARAAAAAMFDRLDQNGDGRVTEDERPQR